MQPKKLFTLGSLHTVVIFVGTVILPAAGIAYRALAATWGLPFAEEVAETALILEALIGAVFLYSRHNYLKEQAAKAKEDEASAKAQEASVMVTTIEKEARR
jgi:hypothetical protein